MDNSKATRGYREAAIRGATQVGLVIMMYDMIIEDLTRACEGIRDGNVERRTSETKHAFAVLEQLQANLNPSAGEPAKVMDHFYSIARAKILEANIKNSAALLQEVRRLFCDVKDSWKKREQPPTLDVGETLNTTALSGAANFVPTPTDVQPDTCEWSA